MTRLHLIAVAALIPGGLLVGCAGEGEGACGTDHYPAAPDGATATVHVSAGCPAEGADGSAGHPYPTIQDGVSHAGSGAAVVIAPGTYPEHIDVARSVALVGSADPAQPSAAATVIVASHTPVTSCEGTETNIALSICEATDVILRGLRISGAVAAAIKATGSDVTIEDTVVEDTAAEDGQFGHGIIAVRGSNLTLRDSVVSNAANVGVFVSEARAIILQNVVKDGLGPGVLIDHATSEVRVEGNTIEGNTQLGIGVFNSRAIILQNQIRGTLTETRPELAGIADGILVSTLDDGTGTSPAPDVDVRDNEISGHGRVGVLLSGETAGIILQNNTVALNAADTTFGAGVWLQAGAGNGGVNEISSNVLTQNKFMGIGVTGDTHGIILQNNQILQTEAQETFAGPVQVAIGDGIGVFSGASAKILGNTVRDSGRFGLILDSARSAEMVIETNTFEANESAIILQNQARGIDTDNNTFDPAHTAVEAVPSGRYGVKTEEFLTR